MKLQRAKRPIAQTVEALMMNRLAAASRAAIVDSTDPGVPLAKPRVHPRLYAVAALRGLRQIEYEGNVYVLLDSLWVANARLPTN